MKKIYTQKEASSMGFQPQYRLNDGTDNEIWSNGNTSIVVSHPQDSENKFSSPSERRWKSKDGQYDYVSDYEYRNSDGKGIARTTRKFKSNNIKESNMKQRIQLKESQLKAMIAEAVRNVLKEDLNKPFDFEDFVEILDKNGYAYDNYYDVSSKDGRSGTRFEISAYPYNNPTTDLNTLKQELINAGGADRFIFSQGVHRYAPELKSFSIILLDN